MTGESWSILAEIFHNAECCILMRDDVIYVNILLKAGVPVSACSTKEKRFDEMWIGFQYLGEEFDLNVYRVNDSIQVNVHYCNHTPSGCTTDTDNYISIPVVSYNRIH